ncbi:MAG TPA: acyl-CoA dehydrogenase, partial [Devosia sp.]|nr:acyl-CoA dehydrogenase [Devosia sp.]
MSLLSDTTGWAKDEHHMFSDMVGRFFADEMAPQIENWVAAGVVDRAFWHKAGAAGIMGGAVAEEYGGAGGDIGFDAIALYEQARLGDVNWGMGIQSIVIHYISTYGSDAQKARWLPGLVSGETIGALAMTEPGTGSDLKAVRTSAERDGNHYRVNGSKIFITNGSSADLVITVTKTDPDAGTRGVSLIVVEPDEAEGFRRGSPLKKLGMKGNDTAELFYEDVKVPITNLLGEEEGQGFYQLMKQLPWERLLIAIQALGAMDFALEQTIAYVQERKAFGQRVMDFQNTRFKLAECKTKTEVLRAFTNDSIGRLVEGRLDAA